MASVGRLSPQPELPVGTSPAGQDFQIQSIERVAAPTQPHWLGRVEWSSLTTCCTSRRIASGAGTSAGEPRSDGMRVEELPGILWLGPAVREQ